jgi:hypothetical protein
MTNPANLSTFTGGNYEARDSLWLHEKSFSCVRNTSDPLYYTG